MNFSIGCMAVEALPLFQVSTHVVLTNSSFDRPHLLDAIAVAFIDCFSIINPIQVHLIVLRKHLLAIALRD